MKFNAQINTILKENENPSRERSQDEIRKDFESLYTMFEGLPRGVKQAREMGWKVTSNKYQEEYICEDPSSKDNLTTDKDSYSIETFKNEGRFYFDYNDNNNEWRVPKFQIISDTPLKTSNGQEKSSDTDLYKTTGDRLFHILSYYDKGNKYMESWSTRIDDETEYYKEYPWWLQNKEKAEKIGIDISPVSKEEEEF